MKKALYILLLLVEAVLSLLSLGLLSSWLGWFGFGIFAAVFLALLIWAIVYHRRQKSGGDAAAMRKARVRLALALLLPTAVALAVGIWTVVSMMIYFG